MSSSSEYSVLSRWGRKRPNQTSTYRGGSPVRDGRRMRPLIDRTAKRALSSILGSLVMAGRPNRNGPDRSVTLAGPIAN
jgi:hypothetical protein